MKVCEEFKRFYNEIKKCDFNYFFLCSDNIGECVSVIYLIIC